MKNLLIVVDMQNDFIDGALGFDGADKLEKVCLEKISTYEKNGDDIVFTLDTHAKDYLNTIEGKYLNIPHCIKGTTGWQLYGKLKEVAKHHKIIEKPTFGSWELGEFIKNQKEPYKKIELIGLVSNICVISNAVIAKSASPESHILVDANATSSYDMVMQEKTFDLLENLHIEVINR